MKTLKELENEKLKQENAKIRNLIKSYKRDDISPATKSFILAKIKQSKKAIGNITDFVKQEIAKNANVLFEGIRDSLTHKDFRKLYYGYFEDYIEKVASLEEKAYGYEKMSNVVYNEDLQRAILYFGLTREELEFLFKNGLTDESRDIIMAFINKRYKTSIPTLEELRENALNDEIYLEYQLTKLRNGEYLTGEYPSFYEIDLKDLNRKSKLKRILK
jgi:hypothetical protein